MRQYSRSMALVATVWLVVCSATPVRRSPDLEARRRSAIDRSLIRFGRAYPAEPSAADIREAVQRNSRASNAFLRFGRSQPIVLSAEDLESFLRSRDDEYEPQSKRKSDLGFVRFGRDPKFVRFGKSENKADIDQSPYLVNAYPQRQIRGPNSFIRLGRDTEEPENFEEEEERRKRSTSACDDCQ